MKGMSFSFACTRVFEFESKKEMPLNRLMLKSYLDSLERGLQANKQLYMDQRGLKDEDLQKMAAHSREFTEGDRTQQRQFEVMGYKKMIERMIEMPLKAARQKGNKDLVERLEYIRSNLKEGQDPRQALEEAYDEQRKLKEKTSAD